MNKILAILVLAGLIVPLVILAQAPDQCIMKIDTGITECDTNFSVGDTIDYDWTSGGVTGAMCCLFSTIQYVVNWIFMALMIIVIILILVGAFSLVTSGGDAEKVAKGRNYVVFALVGVAVALLARALPYLIRSVMGVTG